VVIRFWIMPEIRLDRTIASLQMVSSMRQSRFAMNNCVRSSPEDPFA
jgi:hypothetical protein